MPPIKGSRNSWLMMMATVPMAPPSASEPTSPMKTSAGWALYQRKPMEAPTIDPQKTVSSPTMRHALQFQIVGKDHVAADVGEHGERAGGDDGAADGEAVEAVGEVDGVAEPMSTKMTKTTKGRKARRPRCGMRAGQCQSRSGRKLLMNGTISCVENSLNCCKAISAMRDGRPASTCQKVWRVR